MRYMDPVRTPDTGRQAGLTSGSVTARFPSVLLYVLGIDRPRVIFHDLFCCFFLTCSYEYIYSCKHRCPWRPEASEPLVLMVVSHLVSVLGVKFQSSGRTANARNSLAILPAPSQGFSIRLFYRVTGRISRGIIDFGEFPKGLY